MKLRRYIFCCLSASSVLLSSLNMGRIEDLKLTEIEDILEGILSQPTQSDSKKKKLTLVVFDFDNTLGTACNNKKAHDPWFAEEMDRLIKSGLRPEQAVRHVVPIALRTHNESLMQPVDKDVAELIQVLDQEGVITIILTARSIAFLKTTLRQMRDLKIDLTKNAPWKHRYIFTNLPNIAYYYPGILFTGGNDKGRVLEEFLKHLKVKPDQLIFVDDTRKHVDRIIRMAHRFPIKDVKVYHFIRYNSPEYQKYEASLCKELPSKIKVQKAKTPHQRLRERIQRIPT